MVHTAVFGQSFQSTATVLPSFEYFGENIEPAVLPGMSWL
jgi:hypothetical protein